MSAQDSGYLSDYYGGAWAKGWDKGEAKGQAKSVLLVLEGRGIAVSAAERKQILACRDRKKTREWARRAGTANSLVDVLG